MPNHEKTAFTEEQLTEWLFDISRKAPTPVSRNPQDWNIATGLALAALPTGMVMKFATEDGNEVTVMINPALAHHIRKAIMKNGKMMGWMQDDETVSFPIVD